MIVHKIINLLDKNLSFRIFIKSYEWSSTRKKGEILVTQKGLGLLSPILVRAGTSDLDVFRQTFIGHSYRALLEYAEKHNAVFLKKNKLAILDCGSNIGLSALFFISAFRGRDLEIYCVEADPENYALNVKNTAPYPFVKVLHRAVWDSSKGLILNQDFRDHKHWSRNVSEANNNAPAIANAITVEGITLQELIEQFSTRHIDILKIDIEGAEVQLFESDSIDDILKNVESIAIEIHDEFDCRQMICDRLSKNNFRWTQAGELTIGIKNHQKIS